MYIELIRKVMIIMSTKDKVPNFLKFSLESLRVRKGWTQEEAAGKLGMGRDKLRVYEKDSSKLDYETILKIEEVYNIPQDYIFFGKSTAFSVMLESSKKEEKK